ACAARGATGALRGLPRDPRIRRRMRTPYYLPIGDEVEVFNAAYANSLPVLLKGPTGCGKTRFVEYMASTLKPAGDGPSLVTVGCPEDLTGSDLVARVLI